MDRFAATFPSGHRACFDDLEKIANDAASAVKASSHDGIVSAMRRAARALARLGAAANAPIVPDGFEALENIAAAEGAAFCVSGAGGGDVATYLGSTPPSAAFVERALGLGLFEIDVDIDEKGVRAITQPAAIAAATAG